LCGNRAEKYFAELGRILRGNYAVIYTVISKGIIIAILRNKLYLPDFAELWEEISQTICAFFWFFLR
jgi:hypothetical protein